VKCLKIGRVGNRFVLSVGKRGIKNCMSKIDDKLQGILYDYTNDLEHLRKQDERVRCRNRYRLAIEALYKPLGRYKLEQIVWNEIQCAIQDCPGLKEDADEEIGEILIGVEGKIAQAIINARGER